MRLCVQWPKILYIIGKKNVDLDRCVLITSYFNKTLTLFVAVSPPPPPPPPPPLGSASGDWTLDAEP